MALHIYRVGRSVPVRSRNPIKSRVKIQLLTRIGRFVPVRQGAGLPGGIPHPDSELDVLYMHFDRLDEIYAMVQSNLQFDKLI